MYVCMYTVTRAGPLAGMVSYKMKKNEKNTISSYAFQEQEAR